MKNLEKAEKRYQELKNFDNSLRTDGVKYIAGVDEVGRGCLAGPVVAAAVVLPEKNSLVGVDDSKKLSEKKRLELFKKIKDEAISYSIGMVSNDRIDDINILEATKEAMEGALILLERKMKDIGKQIDLVIIDAVSLDNKKIMQKNITKGDEKSLSVAAASILAKVTRDNLMIELSKAHPQYMFQKNKGYGTKEHYKGLEEYGISDIHRKSFLKKFFDKVDK